MEIRQPDNSHRLSVVGRTGTGKTTAGLFQLSLRDTSVFPWLLFNAKRDPIITQISKIPQVEQIGFKDKIGKRGLYILSGLPSDFKSDAMENFLSGIHARGRVGLYLDEGYVMDPRSDSLNNIYTQGRSLRIPVITLSQRPSWISQFSFSEADFIQAFDLNRREDQKRVEDFTPFDMKERLPDYHSRWYDVGRNSSCVFSPVPGADAILDNFDHNLRPRRKVI